MPFSRFVANESASTGAASVRMHSILQVVGSAHESSLPVKLPPITTRLRRGGQAALNVGPILDTGHSGLIEKARITKGILTRRA